MDNYNFNEHIEEKFPWYAGGFTRKIGVYLDDNKEYLLKLPQPKNDSNSYMNNVVSEYIGCKIMQSVGLPVQNVILGEYTYFSRKDNAERTCIACACESFNTEDKKLMKASQVSLSTYPKLATIPKFSTLDNISKLVSDITTNQIKEFYSEMFVMDAFIGSINRNNDNWGFLINKDKWELAPIYNCGYCLSPSLDDKQLKNTTLLEHTFFYPTRSLSAILDENGKRICYKDYILSYKNDDVNNALKRIIPKIKLDEINKIIDDIQYISSERKDFYKLYLNISYEQILIPALEHLQSLDINEEYLDL